MTRRTLGAAARALGLTEKAARTRAAGLRRRGVKLKRMPRRTLTKLPAPKAVAVERLHRRGVSVPEIIQRTGASRAYVFLVIGQLRKLGIPRRRA
jgi:biotin operon repressor